MNTIILYLLLSAVDVKEMILAHPEDTRQIVIEAIRENPELKEEIQRQAIEAGADPALVYAATAAGLTSLSVTFGAAAKVPSGGSGHGGVVPRSVSPS